MAPIPDALWDMCKSSIGGLRLFLPIKITVVRSPASTAAQAWRKTRVKHCTVCEDRGYILLCMRFCVFSWQKPKDTQFEPHGCRRHYPGWYRRSEDLWCISMACTERFKGTSHDCCWSRKPINHFQKQGNIHIFQHNNKIPMNFLKLWRKTWFRVHRGNLGHRVKWDTELWTLISLSIDGDDLILLLEMDSSICCQQLRV